MSALPAALPPRRLRVAVVADRTAAWRRLAELVALSGHDVVAASEPADAVLTEGTAMPAPPGLPVVAIGEAAFGEADGILTAAADPVQLDAALRAVAAGLIVRLPAPVAPGFAALPEDPMPALTPREVEVLSALAAGLGNKAVARRLAISPHTVKFHIESLFRKLGAQTRAEAVAKGLRRQIVEL